MSAANSPNYFSANTLLSDNASEKGLTNFLTVEDPDLVNLIDKYDISSVNFLEIYFQKCQNETSLSPCASLEQIDQKIVDYTILLGSLTNFIQYDEMEPGVGPIKRIYSTFLWILLARVIFKFHNPLDFLWLSIKCLLKTVVCR